MYPVVVVACASVVQLAVVGAFVSVVAVCIAEVGDCGCGDRGAVVVVRVVGVVVGGAVAGSVVTC